MQGEETEQSPAREGQILGNKFQLISLLARGGMSEVWSARHLRLDAQVAIKFLSSSAASSRDSRARFIQEAHALAALGGAHIVQVMDYGETQQEPPTPYIAMELLKGETLAEKLVTHKRLSTRTTAHMVTQVARALTVAHGAGVVHRDLKPHNIFLCDNVDEELVKVIDFGIAKTPPLGYTSRINTETGTVLGTPQYMSPEQLEGKKVGPASDLWALGVIALECILGRRLFESPQLGELVLKITREPIPVPSTLCNVPNGLDAWAERALARDPAKRFANAQSLAEELCNLDSRRSSHSSMPTTPETHAGPQNLPVGTGSSVPPPSPNLEAAMAQRTQTVVARPVKRLPGDPGAPPRQKTQPLTQEEQKTSLNTVQTSVPAPIGGRDELGPSGSFRRMTPTYAAASYGPLNVVIWRGRADLDAIDWFTKATVERLKTQPDGGALIAIYEESMQAPRSTDRTHIAAANDQLHRAGIRAFLGVTALDGFFRAWVIGVATTLAQLARLRYPMKAFHNVKEAIEFAATLPLAIDREKCTQAVEEFRAEYAQFWHGESALAKASTPVLQTPSGGTRRGP